MYNDDVFGEIEVSPKNTMKFKVKIIGTNNSDKYVEITSRASSNNHIPSEIQIEVGEDNYLNSEINIAYRGNSYVYTEIQPMGFNGIEAEIEVRPHNRMSSLYEIVEPPRVTTILNPIKDAFTRENAIFGKVNYGGYTSLNIGSDSDNIFRSYLKFNFDTWNPFYKIIDVKLRLYYSGVIPDNVGMEIFTIDEYWSEYGINDYNRPRSIEFVEDEYINNTIDRYVEFDLTKLTKDWLDKIVSNNGIVIRYKDELNRNYGYVKFKSRESVTPPELRITSYDARIYSYGRSYVPTEIFVWIKKDSDILTEIEVSSVYKDNYIPTEIWCHKYEYPVWEDIETEITVNKPYIPSEITIYQSDETDVLTEITSRVQLDTTLDTEIIVNKPSIASEIEIKTWNNIETEINIRAFEVGYIPIKISISREIINSEIFVRAIDNSYVESEITVDVVDDYYVPTEISVNRDFTYVEITPRLINNNYIESEIEIRAIGDNSIITEISVTRDSIYTEITTISYNEENIDTEIEVKSWNSIFTEIEIFKFSDVLTEIEVVESSYIPIVISVTRDSIYTEITVWSHAESNIPTEITARVENLSAIETQITVKGKGGAYVIMY